jgi:hypothetical protein
MKNILWSLLLFALACNNDKTTSKQVVADSTTAAVQVPPETEDKQHSDDGNPYFSFTLTKNGVTQVNVTGDKPVFITGENEMTVLLDSSRHLLTNGDILNLYIAGHTAKRYPVTEASHIKDSASVILTFAKPTGDMPLFSATVGNIIVDSINSQSCSGNFQASRKESNGDIYVLKGLFQHAKLSY